MPWEESAERDEEYRVNTTMRNYNGSLVVVDRLFEPFVTNQKSQGNPSLFFPFLGSELCGRAPKRLSGATSASNLDARVHEHTRSAFACGACMRMYIDAGFPDVS
jgi:hypothetical protein